MNIQQEVYFSMILKVRNFGNKNAAVLSTVPGATAQFTVLGTQINNLITADSSSRSDLTGYAMTKANKRTGLESSCLKFSNGISAFAANTGDLVLQKKADFTASFWSRATEDELLTNASILKNLATPIIASLTPYFITAADLTTFGTQINGFTDTISDPTLAIDQRKVDNEKIPQIMDEIRTLFETKLDVMMKVLEYANPSMYELYGLARAQDQRGSMTTPTAQTTVEPGTTITAHTAPSYNADTFYTIQNLGTETVFFSLSTESKVEGADPVLLAGGETRVRLASNLASKGTFLVVRNSGETSVAIKVWVE